MSTLREKLQELAAENRRRAAVDRNAEQLALMADDDRAAIEHQVRADLAAGRATAFDEAADLALGYEKPPALVRTYPWLPRVNEEP